MKKILALATASLSVFGAISPAHSGLGDAATDSSAKGYDAWCGKKGNNCNVKFVDGRIIVNDKDSVRFEDITYITKNGEYTNIWTTSWVTTFGIEYLEEGMNEPEFAEILFANQGAANRFWTDLRRACRKCKNRDATLVEVNIND